MKTYSITPFFDELDVLEIRLAELDDVVDVFVLCEATSTHSGQPKALYLRENMERFESWESKIRIVTIDFPARLKGNWDRENYQRDQLKRGLHDLGPDDLVILSDLDEIPRASFVRECQAGAWPLPIAVSVPIHVYRLNWRWTMLEDGFAHIRFFYGSMFSGSPQGMFATPMQSVVGEHGWHFTYQGDAAKIATKIGALADEWIKEDPSWLKADHIDHSIETGVDVFGRDYRTTALVPISELPAYVQENQDKFSNLLVERPR